MVSLADSLPGIRTADGVPLRISLRRAERRSKLRALALVAPLLAFILLTFVVPIAFMLYRAIENPEIIQNLPRTSAALARWDGRDLPDEATYAALAADLKETQKTKNTGLVGKRLNYEVPGSRSKIIKTGRDIERTDGGPWKEAFLKIDPLWGTRDIWVVLERASHPFTSFYLLAAIPNVPADILKDLPTAPENSKNVLVNDAQFWGDNGEELRKRFNTWLAQ